MIQVAEKPAALHAEPIRLGNVGPVSQSQLIAEVRKIDAGVDGQLQGPPGTAVHLHEDRISGSAILLEFHHRDTVPPEWRQHASRVVFQPGVEGDALAQHADAAGRRLLSKSPVRERGERLAVVEQDEYAQSGADDARLN